ncbi:hypothetical protein QTI33_24670 [Variovorax sp. J22P271]|uniref:hypothetical protein n=1 Tax=Variovorax davisae TaxID=3053515 RepID=UPI002574EC15|nr:hypothetical protein [Variovorax sp. J22P271]MDM0035351.1 hypothetical protein [Variovorax sp. J22P271]
MSPNPTHTAAELLARGGRADALSSALSPEASHACRRAARALTSHLHDCGEQALSYPQVNLVRALFLAETATGRPRRGAQQTLGMVAQFFTPMQMDFAVELLTEALEGEEGEAWAILEELERMADEAGRPDPGRQPD